MKINEIQTTTILYIITNWIIYYYVDIDERLFFINVKIISLKYHNAIYFLLLNIIATMFTKNQGH